MDRLNKIFSYLAAAVFVFLVLRMLLIPILLVTSSNRSSDDKSVAERPSNILGGWFAAISNDALETDELAQRQDYSFPKFYKVEIASDYISLVDMDYVSHKYAYKRSEDSIWFQHDSSIFAACRYVPSSNNLILEHGQDRYLYKSAATNDGMMRERYEMRIELPHVENFSRLKQAWIEERPDFRTHLIHLGIDASNEAVLLVEGVPTRISGIGELLRMGDGRRKRTHIVKLFADKKFRASNVQEVIKEIQKDEVDSLLVVTENLSGTFDNAYGKYMSCSKLLSDAESELQTWEDFLRNLVN